MKITTFSGLCFALALVTACSSDNTAAVATATNTHYKIAAFTSDTAVDLDNNGVASADLLSEIPNYFNPDIYDLELSVRPQTNLISLYLPQCNVSFDYPSEPNGYTVFSRSATGYQYNENKGQIVINYGQPTPEYIEEFGKLENLEAVKEGELKATISKKYYDYVSAGWKWLTITAKYTKME